MLDLFKKGVSQLAIAEEINRDPSVVNRWFIDLFGAYHAPRYPRFSKQAVHARQGVYFDITTLWEGTKDGITDCGKDVERHSGVYK